VLRLLASCCTALLVCTSSSTSLALCSLLEQLLQDIGLLPCLLLLLLLCQSRGRRISLC
jgi:hypothetical protein